MAGVARVALGVAGVALGVDLNEIVLGVALGVGVRVVLGVEVGVALGVALRVALWVGCGLHLLFCIGSNLSMDSLADVQHKGAAPVLSVIMD